ncbi:hypothetical protein TRIUR3_21465 [Triticum urartu]|uniref:Uncharacterized protein n=2 Tax=Triticum urartu TaxID=4572 RepID=M8AU12_TRIUA|nr:hypothetical protein TRIUR3_21465 [Triticum urartu]
MEAEKPAGRRQVLHLLLSQPRRIGRQIEGHGWKKYTFLEVYFCGEHMKEKRVCSLLLPGRHADVKPWKEHYEFQVDGGWRHLCLRLEAVREDCDVDEDTGRVKVLRTDEPHTSGCSAAIGAAQVRLLDALVLGDDDSDDEAVAEKKSRLSRLELQKNNADLKIIPAKGTLVFYERVELQGWRPPPPGPGRKPTNVVCGTMDVALYVTEGGAGSGR